MQSAINETEKRVFVMKYYVILPSEKNNKREKSWRHSSALDSANKSSYNTKFEQMLQRHGGKNDQSAHFINSLCSRQV